MTSMTGYPRGPRLPITPGPHPFVEITDRATWNDLALALPRHSLYQGFEWGAVREDVGWRAHRYALMDRDRVVGAVALLSRTIPGVRRNVVYAPHGPMMDFKDRDAWTALRALIDHLAGTLRPAFIRFSINAFDSEARVHEAFAANGGTRLPESWTVWNVPRIVMRSDITADEQILWRRVRRRYREYVSAAKRQDVVVSTASTIDEVRAVYDLLTLSAGQRGYPVRSLGYYEALWNEYVAKGTGAVLVARRHGTVLGGLIAARFGDTAYLLHSARGPAPVGGGVNHGPVLCWQFIAWAKAQGCDAIDWGGSGTQYPAAATDAGYGVYHFKRGFGASLEYMASYYDFVFEPRVYRVARRVERHLLPAAWDIAGRLNHWRRYTPLSNALRNRGSAMPGAELPIQEQPATHTVTERRVRKLRKTVTILRDHYRSTTTTKFVQFLWNAMFINVRIVVYAKSLEGLATSVAHETSGVVRGTPADLEDSRKRLNAIPWELQCDRYDGVSDFFICKQDGNIAHISWVYHADDPNRILKLGDGECEVKFCLTVPEMRGKGLYPSALRTIQRDLAARGFRTCFICVKDDNVPSIRGIERAGFRRLGVTRIRKIFGFQITPPKPTSDLERTLLT